ncbi:winged helix-turn-helix transcriptional regulator [Mycolicibacterium confluentis]|nr:helix-turn-helix domain-containing protein [Mycolicibacterium confluentis]MCV7318688.1 helix-turn-helix transcriptional regulator [Mycolicibacterium confluentis]ORV23263.1 HxlR family transcriptional regulator [Mycolicibacterium confluentis]
MLGLLGDEWNLLIVQQSLLGATRFGEYLARLPISNAVLTTRLRGLTGEAMLEQREYQVNPPRTEYLLTPRGRALWPMMLLIWDWERRWVPDHVAQLPAMRHDTCGALFTPLLTCGACTAPSTDTDVKLRWGPSGSWERSTPITVTRRRGGATGPPGLYPETMSVFGNRWSAAILIAAFLGASRFGDFQRQLGAPPASVSARLRAFVANGVLSGSDEYLLTDKGRAFFGVLVTALEWGQHWFHAPEGPAVVLTHRACGERFTARVACDQCAKALSGDDVLVETVTT